MQFVRDVTPEDLSYELKSVNPPLLLDVRERHELEISRLPNIVHIPLGQLVQRYKELDREAKIVVVCRTGSRSANATAFLSQQGFLDVRSLVSGMNGWSLAVDPSVPIY